jgi:hypothetical protein
MTARQQIRVGRLGKDRSPIDAQPAPSVGELLQAAREKKGVDLYRAERDTKIRARHLAALESGDYAELPGAVYTKGFLRNYALYLGLDPEELLARWRDEQDYGRRGEPVTVAPPPQPIAEPRRGFTFTPGILIAAVLSVVVLLFAGYIGIQLVRFSQVPEVAVQGDRVINLPPDATTVVLRGTAGPRAVISFAGPSGLVVASTSADEAGAWATELGVSKGRNDFTIVAKDADTGRESPPVQVTAVVALPATPTPAPTPVPAETPIAATPVAVTPAPQPTPTVTLAPGATATPVPPTTPTPAASPAPVTTSGPAGTARLEIAAPADLASIENDLVRVAGSTDASNVTVTAAWTGPAGGGTGTGQGSGPKAPDPVTSRVRSGSFETSLPLPNGRWAITVTTEATGSLAAVTTTRTVDVKHTGLFLTVEARGGSAWIRVWVDGELVSEGRTFRRNELEAFTARRSVVVSTGNAGATYVVINGQPYGFLGDGGSIVTMQFEKGKDPQPLG